MSIDLVETSVSIFTLLIGSIVFGALTTFFGWAISDFVLQYFVLFYCGALMINSLNHILPEAREGWNIVGFTPFMSLGVGVFLALLVDKFEAYRECVNGRRDGEKKSVEPATGSDNDKKEKKAAKLLFLVELIALSSHVGLEGLHVGIEMGKNASDLWYLLSAIGVRTVFYALCLGIKIPMPSTPYNVKATPSSKCFKWVCVFGYAAMAPAGMGLGVVITAMANHPSQTELPFFVPIFQCVAGGAVLYAALAEVILGKRSRPSKKGLMKLAAFVLGAILWILLDVYFGHSYSTQKNTSNGHPSSNETSLPVIKNSTT